MPDLLVRNEEQRLLYDTALRVFGAPQQLERNLAESGLFALPFVSADGGLRSDGTSDCTDLAIAFAAKGTAYAVETMLFQAVLGGGLIAASKANDRAAIVEGIIDGRERVAVGLHERRARTDFYHCKTHAARTATGWKLEGTKTLVLGVEGASRLIVVADLGLFLLDLAEPGVTCRHYRLRDGTPASDVTLTGVELAEAALIAEPDAATEILQSSVAVARLCLAAEASGLMAAALAGTAAYVSERKQFGQPIGNFQVIQHRLADMATLTDQSAALVADVAARSADIDAIDQACKAIAEMGMTATKSAIQLHGGYGMTEDLPYGQALRRMMTIALLF